MTAGALNSRKPLTGGTAVCLAPVCVIALIGAQMFRIARNWTEGNAVDASSPSLLFSRPIVDELRFADIGSTVRAIRPRSSAVKLTALQFEKRCLFPKLSIPEAENQREGSGSLVLTIMWLCSVKKLFWASISCKQSIGWLSDRIGIQHEVWPWCGQVRALRTWGV